MAIHLPEVSELTVTTLIDNSIDSLLANDGPARRQPLLKRPSAPLRVAPLFDQGDVGHELRAEHALSLLIDFTVDGESHRVLMDAGRTTDGLASNMRCLGLDPASIEGVIISHGHGDHTGGLNGIVADLNKDGPTPLFAHPDVFPKVRYKPDGVDYSFPERLSESALLDYGFRLNLTPGPTVILDGIAVSGEVPRMTEYEITGGGAAEKLKDGKWVPDELLDEQTTILRTARGLVLLVGCNHNGVINAIRYAQEITGERRIHALIGGLHLSGRRAESAVEPTINELVNVKPDYILPSHCTGFRAAMELAQRMPDALIPNSVGTKFVLA